MSEHEILCGHCKTGIEGPAEPSDNDVIRCPECGQSDRFADVMESVTNYATDSAGRYMQESMKSTLRGSKFVTFKPGHIPNRTYRWIVADLEL